MRTLFLILFPTLLFAQSPTARAPFYISTTATSPAGSPVTYVASASLTTGWGDNTTASLNCGSSDNRMLYVVTATNGQRVTSVTYNSVSCDSIFRVANASYYVYVHRLIAPATGSHTVSVTTEAATTHSSVAICYSGVHQTTPNGTIVTAQTGWGSSLNVDVSSASGDTCLAFMWSVTGQAVTWGAGITERFAQAGYFQNGAGSKSATSTTTNMAATVAADATWDIIAFALKAAQ